MINYSVKTKTAQWEGWAVWQETSSFLWPHSGCSANGLCMVPATIHLEILFRDEMLIRERPVVTHLERPVAHE